MSKQSNRKIILKARPDGFPTESDFELLSSPIGSPGEGEGLCRTIYMSLDPYMRGRMNEGKSYAEPVKLGEVMGGGTVSQVIKSEYQGLTEGDIVLTHDGWQEYAVSKGKLARKLDPKIAPISTALGILGMPGMTAYMGLLEIGKPKQGETLVVAAASGAVGSAVGQIAKRKGCRVVGIAGSQEKCDFVVDKLGFDNCINHRSDDLFDQLKAACPDGIDIYFENVGGKVFEAVIPLLNFQARIPVCGIIANYNDTGLPDGPNYLPRLMRVTLTQRVKIQGFIVTDFAEKQGEFAKEMGQWVSDGDIFYKEDVIEGIENTIGAFLGLLRGGNFGKLLVRLSD